MTEDEIRLECLKLAITMCASWVSKINVAPDPVSVAQGFYRFVTGRVEEAGVDEAARRDRKVADTPHSRSSSWDTTF